MRIFVTTVVLFLSLLPGVSACHGNKQQTSSVSSAEASLVTLRVDEAVDLIVNSVQGTLTVIDVRTPQEVEQGAVEGAINIDFYSSDFEKKVADLDRQGRYLLYCRSGNRAARAAVVFRSLGFIKVYFLRPGGYADLRAANTPTTR